MCFGVAGAHSGHGRSFRPKGARRPTEYLAERDRPVKNLRRGSVPLGRAIRVGAGKRRSMDGEQKRGRRRTFVIEFELGLLIHLGAMTWVCVA